MGGENKSEVTVFFIDVIRHMPVVTYSHESYSQKAMREMDHLQSQHSETLSLLSLPNTSFIIFALCKNILCPPGGDLRSDSHRAISLR